jgi:hypothetical protein
LFTGIEEAGAHDPVFVSLFVFPSFCEAVSGYALAERGVANFSRVRFSGIIGNCTLSIHVYFAGGQKATTRPLDRAIFRNIVSPKIAPILPISNSVTADTPFFIPRENLTTTSNLTTFHTFQLL